MMLQRRQGCGDEFGRIEREQENEQYMVATGPWDERCQGRPGGRETEKGRA